MLGQPYHKGRMPTAFPRYFDTSGAFSTYDLVRGNRVLQGHLALRLYLCIALDELSHFKRPQ
ncbi:hypothetical protein CBM2634_U650003 [Cupriavidus taiwanensis]|uniref:Uncharacterized protein n=1 Tax=Cupriavidus taiwanensis TaxID=164546 RepID=A0A375JCZ2_9BURK|nr:hypothetical protein CBM2634_U650003 [Cupriavidus taiwanensis]